MSILPEPAWFKKLAGSDAALPPEDAGESTSEEQLTHPDAPPELAEARALIEEIRAAGVGLVSMADGKTWTLVGMAPKIGTISHLIPEIHRLHKYVMAILLQEWIAKKASAPASESEHSPIPTDLDLPAPLVEIRSHHDQNTNQIRYDLELAIHWHRLWAAEIKHLKDRLRDAEEDATQRRSSLLNRFFHGGKFEEPHQ